jgi:hypothetical protein
MVQKFAVEYQNCNVGIIKYEVKFIHRNVSLNCIILAS